MARIRVDFPTPVRADQADDLSTTDRKINLGQDATAR